MTRTAEYDSHRDSDDQDRVMAPRRPRRPPPTAAAGPSRNDSDGAARTTRTAPLRPPNSHPTSGPKTREAHAPGWVGGAPCSTQAQRSPRPFRSRAMKDTEYYRSIPQLLYLILYLISSFSIPPPQRSPRPFRSRAMRDAELDKLRNTVQGPLLGAAVGCASRARPRLGGGLATHLVERP